MSSAETVIEESNKVLESETNDEISNVSENCDLEIEIEKIKDNKDGKNDIHDKSDPNEDSTNEISSKEDLNLPERTSTSSKSSKEESSISMIDYFKSLIVSSIHASSQFLLSWIGIPLGRSQVKYSTDQKSQIKRKRSDLKESGGPDHDDSVSYEEEDSPGLEEKRWRPDIVLQAVERFITTFWGEKDSNENIKDNDNDENMNSFISSSGNEGNWNKRPDLNFFSDSFVSDIKDVNDKGIKGTSTPQIFLEGEAAGNIFVFSAEKSERDASGISPGHDVTTEEKSLSHLTFEEKQAYFAQQIKVQEEAAARSKPTGHGDEKTNCLTVDGKDES